MTRLPRPLLFAILLGLVPAGLAAAEGDVELAWGDVTAASARAEGSASLEASLVAFLQEQTQDGEGGADPAFLLRARELRVEVDSVDPSVHDGIVFHSNVFPTTVPSSHSNATVAGLVERTGYRWNLFSSEGRPLPRVSFSSGCAEARPSSEDRVERKPRANAGQSDSTPLLPILPGPPASSRPDTIRDTSHSLQWTCFEGARVKVTGDFQLSLWSWNATLTDAAGSRFLMSGREQSSKVPAGAPDLSDSLSHSQEIYLFATNATLVTTLQGTGHSLYTEASVLSASSVRLQSATGHLDVAGQTVDLASSAVRLGGDLQLGLSGTGTKQPFGARLAGTPTEAVVDGKPLSFPVATAGTSLAWLWMAGAVGLGAVLAVPATRLATRRSGAAATACAEDVEATRGRMEEGDFAGALRMAEKAVKSDRNDPEAHFLRALCLGRLGQSGKALAAHRDADNLLQALIRRGHDLSTLRAENAFEAARCCMRLAAESPSQAAAHRDRASSWLKAAIRLQGIFIQEGQEDPLLAGLFPSLQKGAPARDWWNEA